VLTFIVTLLVSTAFGIAVGLLAWRKFLSEWSNALAPVALLSIIAIATAGFLTAATTVNRRRAAREEVEAAGLALYGRPGSASLSADLLLPIVRDPRLPARLAELPATSSPAAGVSLLARAGIARLDAEARDALFEIRRTLADASPDVCAAFWTGNVDPETLASAMRKLDEPAQRTWITNLARAAELELAATSTPARITGEARAAAMTELATALSPDARAAFDRASSAARPASQEACAGFRALAEGLRVVAPATRQLLLRIVMNPEIVDRTP
jgi:hypothetical protein